VLNESGASDGTGFKLSVNVQMVMVDATVKDRGGRPLDNLTQKDFHVYEDGVEQEIRNFSRDEYPLAIALVIDRSGSVAPHMNDLRRAAYQALQQLKRGDQVALFSFAGEVERLEELTTDRQRIADRISTIRAGGGTNIIDALFDATYYLAQVAPDRRRAVILISDNVNTTRPRTSEGQVIRMALETETVIHSVKTPGEFMPLTMRIPNWMGGAGSVDKITAETGGEIIDVTGLGSFDAALSAAITRLKLRYTLAYYPSNTARDGTFRKIDVRLAERFGRPAADYSVHARRGYYSGADRSAARSNP
jgi:VWFA-related protein